MRKICLLLGPLLVVTATGCGSPKPGSTPRLEQTKLHDVVSSRLARLVLDPSAGLVNKGPVVADNINYISQSLIQPTTDVPGHEDGLINVLKRAKAAGAHIHRADCTLAGRIFIDGTADIQSTYAGVATWPVTVSISEAPVLTYATPTYITGKTFEIQVEIAVGGGTRLPTGDRPTTPAATTCSKAIASLLE